MEDLIHLRLSLASIPRRSCDRPWPSDGAPLSFMRFQQFFDKKRDAARAAVGLVIGCFRRVSA